MARRPWIFVGNHPALDFLNTRPMRGGRLVDLIESWDELLGWMVRAGLLSARQAATLAQNGPEAGRGLRLARELRETIRDLMERRRNGRLPLGRNLAAINLYLASPSAAPALTARRGVYRIEERTSPRTVAQILEPIAAAAAHLLCDSPADRLRVCARSGCVLWFLDTSKNGRRRWCSMATCGNRVKAALHYRRAK